MQADPAMIPDLTVPVHFVAPDHRIWPELRAESVPELSDATLAERVYDGVACWVLYTHYLMRRHGVKTTISGEMRADCINVVPAREFKRTPRGPRHFVLIHRQDAYFPFSANFVLHQNGLRADRPSESWVHLWRAPGLVPRDPSRGTRVETLTFKGEWEHLEARFKSEEGRRILARQGVDFAVSPEICGNSANWSDYSQADAVLACRNATRYVASIKPATKLVNAWFAELPAMLGPEEPYRALRKSPLDYIEVASMADVIDAITRLKSDPGLYAAMVENGRERRKDFSDAALVAHWVEALNGPVHAAWTRWQRRSSAVSAIRNVAMGGVDRLSRKVHSWKVRHGPRILDDPRSPETTAIAPDTVRAAP